MSVPTGAQALHYTDTLDDGIVVCGYTDAQICVYSELREYSYPRHLKCFWWPHRTNGAVDDVEGIVGLTTPIKGI